MKDWIFVGSLTLGALLGYILGYYLSGQDSMIAILTGAAGTLIAAFITTVIYANSRRLQ